MKIAIFHDYIGAIGGADKLVLRLAKELNADVITTDVDMNDVNRLGACSQIVTWLGFT